MLVAMAEEVHVVVVDMEVVTMGVDVAVMVVEATGVVALVDEVVDMVVKAVGTVEVLMLVAMAEEVLVVLVDMEVIVMKEDVVVMEVVDISGVIPRFLLDRILFAHRPRQVFYLLSDLAKYFICSPTSSSILSALRPRQVCLVLRLLRQLVRVHGSLIVFYNFATYS